MLLAAIPLCLLYSLMQIFTRTFLSTLALLLLSLPLFAQQTEKFHRKAIVADTHNDFPSVAVERKYALEQDLKGKTHTDLNRMAAGGVDLQVFSIFCGGNQVDPFKFANQEIDSVEAWALRNPERMAYVKTFPELKRALRQKKIAALIGVEGGHMIENDLAKLDALAYRGMCYLTLTWNNSIDWAASAADETAGKREGGLSDFGKDVVRRLNAKGVMPDVSHLGEKTFWDLMAVTTKPVIASHSSVYNITPVSRNLKDDQIRAIAKSGGVVFINFFPGFIDSAFDRRFGEWERSLEPMTDKLMNEKQLSRSEASRQVRRETRAELEKHLPGVDAVIDHIDYVVKLVGTDHVGLGADLDGITFLPAGMQGVEDYLPITRGLLDRGYSKRDVKKILGRNFIRVYKETVR